MLISNTLILFSYFSFLAYFEKKKKLTTKCFYYFKSPKNYLAETCKLHDKTADCR